MRKLRYTGKESMNMPFDDNGVSKVVKLEPGKWYHLPDNSMVKALVENGVLTDQKRWVDVMEEEDASGDTDVIPPVITDEPEGRAPGYAEGEE